MSIKNFIVMLWNYMTLKTSHSYRVWSSYNLSIVSSLGSVFRATITIRHAVCKCVGLGCKVGCGCRCWKISCIGRGNSQKSRNGEDWKHFKCCWFVWIDQYLNWWWFFGEISIYTVLDLNFNLVTFRFSWDFPTNTHFR